MARLKSPALWALGALTTLTATVMAYHAAVTPQTVSYLDAKRAIIAAKQHAKDAARHRTREQIEAEDINAGRIWVGMSTEQAEASWGKPQERNVSGGAGAQLEFWHYTATGAMLTFRDGKLERWYLPK